MRYLLILGGAGFVSVAAWAATLHARPQVRGSALGSQDRHRLELQVPIRRHAGGGGRSGRMFFAVEYETVPLPAVYPGFSAPGPAAPGALTGGALAGESDHITAGHVMGSASHPLAHAPAGVDGADTSVLHTDSASAPQSDDAGSATRQPDPGANPYSARPPGAGGPGRPVSGFAGPGLPGPGRPARPPS
jgi:hypothetical protein